MASVIKVDQVQESTPGVGTNFSGNGSASAPTISIGNQTNKGFYHEGANKIGVSVGGNKVGEIGPGYGGFTGNIIQVINYENDYSHAITTSANWNSDILSGVGVSWEFSITPKYANSKIIIARCIDCRSYRNSSSQTGFGISLWRKIGNSSYSQIYTPITNVNGSYEIELATGSGTISVLQQPSLHFFVDQPNSTAIVTYKYSVRVYSGTTWDHCLSATTKGKSFVLLLEIQQ